jgi:3-methyladenine DNA glycosylase/8-oxoguanine DNA glycosylase
MVEAWGPGADWAIAHAPALVGAEDRPEEFVPRHPLMTELSRIHAGLRFTRTNAVFESSLPTILEQKVPGVQARWAYVELIRALGEPAPGPIKMLLPPSAAALAGQPYWFFHRFGIERRRADTIRTAASYARRLEETVSMSLPDAYRRLTALPGFGPWSAAEVAQVALGDADAVSVGDYHLPHLVSWAFTGEPRGTDQRMLELLEPYRGHRARVIRLLLAGGIEAPRFGPRLPLRWIAHH